MSDGPLSIVGLLDAGSEAGQLREMLRDVIDPELGVDIVSLSGCCTVPGRRAAGMTMTIEVAGVGMAHVMPGMTTSTNLPGTSPVIDFTADPGPDWTPYDPVLRPAPPRPNGTEQIVAERPDALVFNGYVNQYDHAPIQVHPGERIRSGCSTPDHSATSFHIVGAQFDTVFKEGAYLLRPSNPEHGAAQTLDLAPAQGGFVEFALPAAGQYPFVDHAMVDTERGAHGVFVAR